MAMGSMTPEMLQDAFDESNNGIPIVTAQTQLLDPVNLKLLYHHYLTDVDDDGYADNREAVAQIMQEIRDIATNVFKLPTSAVGDRARMQFYNYYDELNTITALQARAPSTPSQPAAMVQPYFVAPVSPFEMKRQSTQTSPMQTNSTASLAPIIVPGQTTTLTSQTLPQHAIDSLYLPGNSIPVATSEQDLERYVQLSMQYGPQRAKSIIKTYGYNRETTEPTMDRGRHDYTPMSIARYTDFQPEARDLFQRGLNRWGYPIGPRLLGKQYIDGFR